jgi:hypothetical protein
MFHFYVKHNGGVGHMVERSLRMREARGSIPCTSKFGLDSLEPEYYQIRQDDK